jgi:hypothetical protein
MFIFAIEQDIWIIRANKLLKSRSIVIEVFLCIVMCRVTNYKECIICTLVWPKVLQPGGCMVLTALFKSGVRSSTWG